jgi:hypothetical protein
VIWDEGDVRYYCRQCGEKGFANKRPDPNELAQMLETRRQQMEEEAARERQCVLRLQEQAYWRGWHDGYRAAGGQQWKERGLPDEAVDYYDLGYTPECPYASSVPALTIPYHNQSWDVQTIQYRLIGASTRYIQEPGITIPSFWTMQGVNPSEQPLLLTEGAIKGMVANWRLVVTGGSNLAVVALPNSTPKWSEIERLAALDWPLVYIALDPDTYAPGGKKKPVAARIGDGFHCDVRYVTLPGKIDDLLNSGWTANDVMLFVNRAVCEL